MQQVYTLPDLTPQVLACGGRPIKLGVIGNPIAHSKSPQMQQAGLDAAGIPMTYVRLLAGTAAGEFEAMMQALGERGFIGLNVTIPFKKQAYLLAQEKDELTSLCGAGNTLVHLPAGGWRLHNTDGPGFAQAVQELTGHPLGELRVLLLGACGGAGCALAAQCALADCPRLFLVNRPKPQLTELAEHLRAQTGARVEPIALGSDAMAAAVREADLIVNATSLGLHRGDPLPLSPNLLRPGQWVYDIVTHTTPFCAAAAEHGCRADYGLSMLLWQGAFAFRHWFGTLPNIASMRRALEQA